MKEKSKRHKGVQSDDASIEQEWRVSMGGQLFNVHSDRWELVARRTVDVGDIRRLFPAALREGAIRTLVHEAETLAMGTLVGRLSEIRSFLRFAGSRLGLDTISRATVVSYRHFQFERDGHESAFGDGLRPFLKKWFALGYPGVSRELVEEISAWRLTNTERGAAVNRCDPDDGPLILDEFTSLQALSLTAFEQGDLSLADFSLFRLMAAIGRRPLQIAQVKLRDMDDSKYEDSAPGIDPRRLLLLRVPRIKVKGAEWRTAFRAVALSADLWNLLLLQQRSVFEKFNVSMQDSGLSLDSAVLADVRRELPLFPMWSAVEKTIDMLRELIEDESRAKVASILIKAASSDAWHYQTISIGLALDRVVKLGGAKSRNGTPLKLFPRRLRYTYQSRLEQVGCAPAVIAWNMDHSDTRSLVSYSENGPDKARIITKAMALGLAPFVRIFQGQVVASEAEAEGGDSPEASRILVEGAGGATCVTLRGCGMSALPRPCYAGCPHFRPWVDGPHEQFLETILNERQRDLDAGLSNAVISANDQLILGIVQVIRLCEQQRKAVIDETKSASRKKKKRQTGSEQVRK